METTTQPENKLGVLNLLVLILSVYVLFALLVDTFLTVPTEIGKILSLLDNAICVFFIFEFSVRFYRAESKLQFMKWDGLI
jgi:voltage-gated potassium channel